MLGGFSSKNGPASFAFPSSPPPPQSVQEWKAAIYLVKGMYMRRQYKQCATRCMELLTAAKGTIDPIYKTCLTFYAAISYELLGRAAHLYSDNKITLLTKALDCFVDCNAALPAPTPLPRLPVVEDTSHPTTPHTVEEDRPRPTTPSNIKAAALSALTTPIVQDNPWYSPASHVVEEESDHPATPPNDREVRKRTPSPSTPNEDFWNRSTSYSVDEVEPWHPPTPPSPTTLLCMFEAPPVESLPRASDTRVLTRMIEASFIDLEDPFVCDDTKSLSTPFAKSLLKLLPEDDRAKILEAAQASQRTLPPHSDPNALKKPAKEDLIPAPLRICKAVDEVAIEAAIAERRRVNKAYLEGLESPGVNSAPRFGPERPPFQLKQKTGKQTADRGSPERVVLQPKGLTNSKPADLDGLDNITSQPRAPVIERFRPPRLPLKIIPACEIVRGERPLLADMDIVPSSSLSVHSSNAIAQELGIEPQTEPVVDPADTITPVRAAQIVRSNRAIELLRDQVTTNIAEIQKHIAHVNQVHASRRARKMQRTASFWSFAPIAAGDEGEAKQNAEPSLDEFGNIVVRETKEQRISRLRSEGWDTVGLRSPHSTWKGSRYYQEFCNMVLTELDMDT